MTLYLSEIGFNTDSSLHSIAALFDPQAPDALDRAHKALWSVFSRSRDQQRDFLWRKISEDRFLTLSAEPPVENDLLAVRRCEPYSPNIEPGQFLRFNLRASARKSSFTHTRHRFQEGRGKKQCLLQAAREAGQNPEEAIRTWLSRQGERHGFKLTETFVVDRIAVERIRPRMLVGVFEVTGSLEVTDPAALFDACRLGFGSQKGFGNGLMILGR